MKIPRTWQDIAALVSASVPESRQLDYKRAFGSNNELAKDIAAMSLDGGILIFGVDEDANQAAGSVLPVPLQGATTRIEQVAATSVSPPVSTEVVEIEDPSNAGSGVVVVVIPTSRAAPHMANQKYPTRSGTMTRTMDEPEVARLYERRHALPDRQSALDRLLDESDQFSPATEVNGVGRLRVVIASSAAEEDLPQGRQTAQLIATAQQRVLAAHGAGLVAAGNQSEVLDELQTWIPQGVIGWNSGTEASSTVILETDARFLCAGLYTHEGRFSFDLRWNLTITDPSTGEHAGQFCAREFVPAVELAALIALTAEFFSNVPGAGLIYAGIQISGTQDAVSAAASRCELSAIHEGTPRATGSLRRTVQLGAVDARDDPPTAADQLLGRWLLPLVSVPSDQFIERLWRPTQT